MMPYQPKQEAFVRSMSEILHLGLAVSDAMKQLLRSGGRVARIQYSDREWQIETEDSPYPTIRITPVNLFLALLLC